MVSVIAYSLISVLIVSLVSMVGIIPILLHRRKNLDNILLLLVSLSAGTLFGGALLHLLPEAAEAGFTTSVSFLVLAGIVFFFTMEKMIHWHHCHIQPTKNNLHVHVGRHPEHLAPLNLLGDGLHNFVDGLVIAGAYLVSIPVGIATTIAVVLHEVPQEIADFGVLLYAGLSKTRALLFNFASAATAIAGTIIGLALGTSSESFSMFILPFTAGGFLYIAGANLVPELHKECGIKDSILHLGMMILGMLLMYGLTFLERFF